MVSAASFRTSHPPPPSPRKRDHLGNLVQHSPAMPLTSSAIPNVSSRRRDSSSQTRLLASPKSIDAGVDRSTVRAQPPSPYWADYPQLYSPVTPRRSSVPLPYHAAARNAPQVPRIEPVPASAHRVRRRTAPAETGPFQFLRALPGGSFGVTYVARDLGTGRVLCTRVFRKINILGDKLAFQGLLTELLCYKRLAACPASQRPFLMDMDAALQDEQNVIFAMPLMQCDLLAVIRGRGKKSQTRRWVAQIALGIDALHAMGIIHRDIKPENVLLDVQSGTVRIADFNAAFLDVSGGPLLRGDAYSCEFIGSKPYMAQELFEHRWYGNMVDWWALGCLLFDLTAGELLFRSDQQRSKYVGWDHKKEGLSYLAWAADLTDEEESLLAGLVHLKPARRFDLADLRAHSYFKDENGASVFDALQLEALRHRAAPPSHQDAGAEISAPLNDMPLCHVKPRLAHTEADADAYDFRHFGWVNPRGLWGNLS